jgi:hypothetical protein
MTAWTGDLLHTDVVIPGAPMTKKNHSRIVTVWGRPKILPSAPWMAWCAHAAFDLAEVVRTRPVGTFPIPKTVRLNCRALFYRNATRGDAVGYYQGLADLLEKCGILEDDVSIAAWDGSRLRKDAKHPRTEVSFTLLSED